MARLLLVAAGLVIVLGTIVTSRAPTAATPRPSGFPLACTTWPACTASAVLAVPRAHRVTLWSMQRSGAPPAVIRRGEICWWSCVAQGGLGYLQYFTGVPAGLVAFHIALAPAVGGDAAVRLALLTSADVSVAASGSRRHTTGASAAGARRPG